MKVMKMCKNVNYVQYFDDKISKSDIFKCNP